jgi:excisionase family DNA binding protein
VKSHYSYTVGELAALLGVHKNTIRHWQDDGLSSLGGGRPILFHGTAVRIYLTKRRAKAKRPCGPGTLYCFRCRDPRPPALGMVDFVVGTGGTGNLRALCGECGAVMHRRARHDRLAVVMPGLQVQVAQAPPRLIGSDRPSLNCDVERQPK